MFKVAGAVIDQYDDPKFVNHFQAQALFGKELLDPVQLDRLPDTSFAVKIAQAGNEYRRYPIQDPISTAVSCAYFLDQEATLPDELKKVAGYRLAAACEKHGIGIPEELKKYAETNQISVKIEKTVNSHSITDTEDFKKYAAATLAGELGKMTPEDRVLAALELFKIGADQYEPSVFDYVPKDVYGPYLKHALYERKELLKTAAHADMWVSTFKDLMTQQDKVTPTEFANLLIEFDKVAGFRERYKDGLVDPYKACFGGLKLIEKVAEDTECSAPRINDHVLTEAESRALRVVDHIEIFKANFPTSSEDYTKEMSKTASDKWGAAYLKARSMYFK